MVDRLRIQATGPLHGRVKITGAKNAALPILAATVLVDGPVRLYNLPQLRDVTTMLEILGALGASMTMMEDLSTVVDTGPLHLSEAMYHLVRTMRASFLVLGPLLARFGEARVSRPGGCAIGTRPVDWHLKALQQLGATITMDQGYVCAKAPPGGLVGGHVSFPTVSVTGTENILMAAVFAQGTTVIENAAMEPEVVDLIRFLNACGARVEGAGTPTLTVQGVTALHPTSYTVMPDRIEAGTYLTAAAMTRGRVELEAVDVASLGVVVDYLREAGAELTKTETGMVLDMHGERPQAVSVVTQPYPGFPTDMQAQWVTMNAVSEGVATVEETVFENRFMHVNELQRMGARIACHGRTLTIQGQERLQGADVMATDLRASACLVLGGMVADGTTWVDRIYHIDRGYEHIESKLVSLGGSVQRVTAGDWKRLMEAGEAHGG